MAHMKKISALMTCLGWFSFGSLFAQEKFEIDYDKAMMLDAEELAEMGIKNAYEKIKPELKKYLKIIIDIEEITNSDNTKYLIKYKNKEYLIYDESKNNLENSWALATVAFFEIINDQLENSEVKLFALNGGNDLFGVFLTQQQADGSKKASKKKSDWPYIPKMEKPWFGMYH